MDFLKVSSHLKVGDFRNFVVAHLLPCDIRGIIALAASALATADPRKFMIVFRRKKRDQIVINGNIVVTVMNIRGSRVSLGIEAPEGIRILRTELRSHDGVISLPLIDVSDATANSLPTIG
jgi:carbon storage regulator CsrA